MKRLSKLNRDELVKLFEEAKSTRRSSTGIEYDAAVKEEMRIWKHAWGRGFYIN